MAAYWEIAAHLAYDVFLVSVPKYQFSFFPPLGFWSGNLFLIALFPDHCLLVFFLFNFIKNNNNRKLPLILLIFGKSNLNQLI